MNGWRDFSLERSESREKGPPPLKKEPSNMEANLKQTLPQEGTGDSKAGESLGGPSGSSCPTYSGGGEDRSRHAVPTNGEPKPLSNIPESVTKNPDSDITNSGIEETKPELLDRAVAVLQTNRLAMDNMENEATDKLKEHVLDGVVVVEKIAWMLVDQGDRFILQKATFKIKNLLAEMMKKEAKRVDAQMKLLELRRELVENKEIVRCSLGLRSSSSESIAKSNRDVCNVKKTKSMVPVQENYRASENVPKQEKLPLTMEQQLEDMVQGLQITKLGFGKTEDQSSASLYNYMLNSVAIVKKVALITTDSKAQMTLEKAASDVTRVVEEMLMVTKTTLEKELLNPVTPIENVADCKNLEGEKLTNFLRKYLKNTINEYLHSCEQKLLNKREIQSAAVNLLQETKENNRGEKRNVDSRALSPHPEPVYDVWYEMDRFKRFALKRVVKHTSCNASDTSESSDDGSRNDNLAYVVRKQPSWWTENVSELHSLCTAARRQYTRSRRRRQRDEAEEMKLYAVYRSLKNAQKSAIKNAKGKNQGDSEDN